MTLSEMKDWATIIAAGVAGVSAVIALATFWMNRSNQKDALIQKAYYDYLKMALDNPDLAFPPTAKFNYKEQTLDGDKEKFEQYEWFLSAMLVTVHFVRKVRPWSKLWKNLTTNQISYHWEYIETFWDDKRFIENWRSVYDDEMKEGIKKGKDKYPRKSPQLVDDSG